MFSLIHDKQEQQRRSYLECFYSTTWETQSYDMEVEHHCDKLSSLPHIQPHAVHCHEQESPSPLLVCLEEEEFQE